MKNWSIQTKLVVFSGALCFLTAFLCMTLFIVYDIKVMKQANRTRLRSIAEMLAFNGSAAIAFQQAAAAEELLQSVSQQDDIEFAAIFTANAQQLAEFKRNDVTISSDEFLRLRDGDQWQGHHVVRKPVSEDQDITGWVCLIANQDAVKQQAWSHAQLGLLVLVLSIPLSILLSKLSQGIITRPILMLSESATRVTDGDYSMSVDFDRGDEIGALCGAFNNMLKQIGATESKLRLANDELKHHNTQLEKQKDVASQAHGDAQLANRELTQEIRRREEIEKEREELHEKLIEASREAGKAEIATGVLHNVGNVMNSVNVSATILRENVERKIDSQLQAAITLLSEHEENLGSFFAKDKRAGYFLPFLKELGKETHSVVSVVDELQQNIVLVNSVVASQQSFATTSGMIAKCELPELIDGALKITTQTLNNHAVDVEQDYAADVPTINVDKQRLVQILVNLIRNAKHAIVDSDTDTRKITMCLRRESDDSVIIEVSDTGVGISEENLGKIFEHGFSTRKHDGGHGFGLHHSFCSASEMGGRITVFSRGLGHGATFRVHLPVNADAPLVIA